MNLSDVNTRLVTGLMLATTLVLANGGCTGESAPTDGATQVATASPTPSAVPSPTPSPTQVATVRSLPQWQAFVSFQVAAEDDGLDYDGDGTKDNAIYAAFDLMVETLVNSIDQTIESLTDYPGQEDPCETQPNGCPLTPPTGPPPSGPTLYDKIAQVLSVDTLNEALATAYARDRSPQALYLNGDGTGLDYWSGQGDVSLWTPEIQIGSQTGFLSASGSAYSGSFTFSTTLGETPQSDGTELSFKVRDARTVFDWRESSIDGALTGGGIKIVELTNYVAALLVTLDEAGVLVEGLDQEAAVRAVETVLTDNSDITCDGGEPCFSITFTYDAEVVASVNP